MPKKVPSGIVVVDKPANITSAQLVARVKRVLGVKKVGHTGTLDPFATGVMICCINQATRLAQFFLAGDKAYDAVLTLGAETDTQDITGTVTATCDTADFPENQLKEVFRRFTGEIDQLPPVYSALKHQGVPLYKLARQGRPMQKPPRRVRISRIDILDISLPDIRFRVRCSAGTYIRTLCADIGSTLGCGGYLKELRRIESGGFAVDDAIGIPELESQPPSDILSRRLIPMASALRDMAFHQADPELATRILHGRPLTAELIPDPGLTTAGHLKVVDDKGHLLAVLGYPAINGQYRYCCVFPP